jgi:uncharacterized protein involved in exopolysaccharide biosynthesis
MMLNSFIAKGSKFIAYHWRIAVLILLLLCIVGIPGTWLLVERTYVVTGAVRIAPIWLPGSVQMYIPHYKKFMQAQSEMIISDQVIERVADDLADKGLVFFEDRGSGFIAKLKRRLNDKGIRPEPTTVLKQAILDKIITAEPAIKEALIKISMRWTNSEEAIKIVDSFVRNYIILSNPTQGVEKLAVLKKEQKKLAEELKSLREQITEKQKLATEVEQAVDQNDPIRLDYINADPTLQALMQNLVVLEHEFLIARQTRPTNPELMNKAHVIETLKERIEQRKTELGEIYDGFIAKKTAEAELSFTKERYNAICRYIQQTEMESKRPSRISVAYNAHVVHVRDVRWIFTIVLVLGVVVSTILLIISNRLF